MMAEVPAYGSEERPAAASAPAITIHALKENKAPCGFVWPDPEKPKRKRAPRKKKGTT